jgi:hypothetical protein
MNTAELLSSIDSEISCLQKVRALLTGQDNHIQPAKRQAKKRNMSAAARARIAAAQKKRWAAWKKQKKAA